jgi:hypothetical protein
MQKITKQVRFFTLTGVLLTIVGYLFLLYEGYSLNNDIEAKNKEIKAKNNEIYHLDDLINNKIKQLSYLESKILHITSTSTDANTVRQGESLAIELGIPSGKYFKVTPASENSLENAGEFEKKGYDFLLNKDVEGAIDAFVKSENSYNGYHQVYEIAKYLIKNKSDLSDRNSDNWKVVYQVILSQYSWRMPENYKVEIQEKIK